MRVSTKDDPRYQKKRYKEFADLVGRYIAKLSADCGMPAVTWNADHIRECYNSGMSPLSTAREVMFK